MLKNVLYIGFLCLLFSCQSKQLAVDTPVTKTEIAPKLPSIEISDLIKSIVDSGADSSLQSVYQHNNHSAVWKNDSLMKQGIQWLQNARYHGLNPEDYQLSILQKTFERLHTDSLEYINICAKLDVLLTANIKKCGHSIRFSSLDPKKFDSGWNYPTPSKLPHDSVWINLIKKEKVNLLDTHFEPQHSLYPKLKNELKTIYTHSNSYTYNTIVDPGFYLYKGDSNKYVLPIKRKLMGLSQDAIISMKYDDELFDLVTNLQRKHGLHPDGIIGKQTYPFLNWNTDRYINTLKVNMNRLRWLPDSTLQTGLIVNIASQHLKLFQQDTCVFSAKVIVGRYKNQTPVFQSQVNYLVFNPCWTIPKSIATTTILNGLRRDSNYLEKRNMFACINGVEINTDTIDFNHYSKSYFPFLIFQRTCDQNALGRVKFMFKNSYNIYLHDTPQKSLFNKDIRNFSHGCIRVQNALKLAETVLYKLDDQQRPIQNYLDKGYPEKVYLKHTIPINILYLSCWENENSGEVIFCKDIYIKDYKIVNELTTK